MSGLLNKEETNKVLTKFGKYVIQQSRTKLTQSGSNASKQLYQSLRFEASVGQNSFGIYFEMEDYGKFQDLGVKGETSSAKAPSSPYRFGSGTGRKGGLSDGIRRWITQYKRFQFRDRATGRFLSYEQTAFLISRSIYQTGIKPKRFFRDPFEKAYTRLPDELIQAYNLDLDGLINLSNDTN